MFISYEWLAIPKLANWTKLRVEVVYRAGYESLPQDLRLAVVDLVMYYHKNEQKQRQTIAGATIQNSTTSMRDTPSFPDHIKRVLDMHKVY